MSLKALSSAPSEKKGDKDGRRNCIMKSRGWRLVDVGRPIIFDYYLANHEKKCFQPQWKVESKKRTLLHKAAALFILRVRTHSCAVGP
jgi:hypothetical protein